MRNALGCSSRKGRMDPAGWDEHRKSVRQLKTTPYNHSVSPSQRRWLSMGERTEILMANP